ncbi:MAG TPA: M20/M25/M40 family metallo-hydrolase, partial [Amycolatopsis sp.]|nr:M20/M25/M40 family metallo-hydrolase [Amycolatopsis sp.]
HKGSVRPVIEVVGVAAHAATPQFGVNAVNAAAVVLRRLEDYSAALAGRVHPLLGAATCTPVLIEGGEAPNAVPERCRITLDRRLLPDEPAESVLAAIDEILAAYNESGLGKASIVDCAPSTGGPSETPAEHPFVVACRHALAAHGANDTLGGLTVNCDMTHFRAAGVPALVCGPGRLEVMHAVDEHVVLDELVESVGLYRAMLIGAAA